MEIIVSLSFDAAHRLPCVPVGHKCSNLHGHTFWAEFQVAGELQEQYGWVLDFAEVKAVVRPFVEELDHHYLNEIPGLDNPTSENIARWLWKRVKPGLPGLTRIVVKESPNSAALYRGE